MRPGRAFMAAAPVRREVHACRHASRSASIARGVASTKASARARDRPPRSRRSRGHALTSATPLDWTVFALSVALLLAIDLYAGAHAARRRSRREAWLWSAAWIGVAVAFGGWVHARHGGEASLTYFTAYVLEKSLSIDKAWHSSRWSSRRRGSLAPSSAGSPHVGRAGRALVMAP